MPWKRRRNRDYYYRNQRIGTRVVSEYVGAGVLAELVAEEDAAERRERATRRRDAQRRRQAIIDLGATPVELSTYAETVKRVVADVLLALGFYRHRRQWRRKRMVEGKARALEIYRKAAPTKDELSELQRLVIEHPSVALIGDLANEAETMFLRGWKKDTARMAVVEARCMQLRAQLGYYEATELERMLIWEVVLCWMDYYRILAAHADQTHEFTMDLMDRWNRVLDSKQHRYLKAIEALARVRRLLRLPHIHVNVDARSVHVNEAITSAAGVPDANLPRLSGEVNE